MAPNTDYLLHHLHMKWQETPLEVGNKKRKMFSLLTLWMYESDMQCELGDDQKSTSKMVESGEKEPAKLRLRK